MPANNRAERLLATAQGRSAAVRIDDVDEANLVTEYRTRTDPFEGAADVQLEVDKVEQATARFIKRVMFTSKPDAAQLDDLSRFVTSSATEIDDLIR